MAEGVTTEQIDKQFYAPPLGVQVQEGRPAQVASRTPWQVLTHRSRRYPDPQLQKEFLGNAFLTPQGMLIGDAAYQGLNLKRNRWSAGSGFQAPQ